MIIINKLNYTITLLLPLLLAKPYLSSKDKLYLLYIMFKTIIYNITVSILI